MIYAYHMAVVADVVFAGAAGAVSLAHRRLRLRNGRRQRSSPPLSICCCRPRKRDATFVFLTAVVLIAVMVDRRPITFRTLEVAALIVLAVAPEALVHPSFQSLGEFSA
jgi:competence protein ComEC